MMDLHDRLGRLAGPAVPPTDEQAAADLARGRRALGRRRTVKGAAAGVFAVAAAAAVIAYGTAGRPAAHPASPVVAAPAKSAPAKSSPAKSSPAAPATSPISTARLVAYEGKQPKGYTIDKVPAGWEIQGVSNFVLTIAPVGDKDKDVDSWIGKIAVMLQSRDDHSRPTGTKVKVGRRAGVITVADGPTGTRSLYVKQPNGINLIVQIWDARGWSNEQIATLGAGIHVLSTAQQGRG
jgi:hypothetical protein